jgi:hypothetical protein
LAEPLKRRPKDGRIFGHCRKIRQAELIDPTKRSVPKHAACTGVRTRGGSGKEATLHVEIYKSNAGEITA